MGRLRQLNRRFRLGTGAGVPLSRMRAVKTALVCLLLASVSGAVVEHQLIKYGGPAKRLRGTVADWTGAPISDVQVEVYDNPQVWDSTLTLLEMRSKQRKIGSTITDDKGRYNIRGVPAGQYEVQFSRMGWNILSVLVKVDAGMAENFCVELQISGGIRQGRSRTANSCGSRTIEGLA